MPKRGNPNMKKGAPSVNPTGRKGKTEAKKDQVSHIDGYQNLVTALGVSGYDKRLNTTFTSDHVTRAEAIELWQGDDIAARAIEIPVEDAFRQGFKFSATPSENADVDTKEMQEQVQRAWEELHVMETGQKALSYELAYGGAAIMFGFEGLRPEELATDKPPASFRPLQFMNVLEPEELPVLYHYTDPFRENYGKPAIYTFSPLMHGLGEGGTTYTPNVRIHESHLHIFPGIRVTKGLDNAVQRGWGESMYSRLWRVLRDFNLAWGGVGNLVQDFSQTVMKLKNLAELLAEQGGTDTLKNRLLSMDVSRSILRAIVIDSEEDFQRQTTNVTGLSELLHQYMARVSSAAGGIPITKLFGVAPSGLNSSGESDINQWDDRVKSLQTKKVIPYLERVTTILIETGAIEGAKGKLESWKIEANPLRQPTDQELVATRYTQAQADQIYINTGVLTPDDVANSRYGGDAYSLETVVDWEEREKLRAAMEEQMLNGNLNPDDPDDDAMPDDEDSDDAPGAAEAEEEEADDEDESDE